MTQFLKLVLQPLAWGLLLSGGNLLLASSPEARPGDGPEQQVQEQPPPRQTTSPSPPRFENIRHREDWAGYRGGSDPWSHFKFLPLSEDASVYLSVGGQLRGRTEFWSAFDFEGGDSADDTFSLLRTRLHADLRLGPHLRFFVEGKSALADGRQLAGGPRTLDVDTADLQNAFVDLTLPLENGNGLTFRAGRQELQFGKQRLVSPLDWSNTRPRMFDGFGGILKLNGWRIDGFWSRFVRLRKYSFNNHDSGIDFFGVYASGPMGRATPFTLDLYWLGFQRDLGPQDRHTLGARLGGAWPQSRWDLDLEAAYQFGDQEGRDIRAFMVATQVGHSYPGLPASPRLHLGFDYASGDQDPLDQQVGTFNQLFPLGHAFLGFIDTVGRQNIIDLTPGASFQLPARMNVSVDGHFFWRARTADALYNAGSAPLRPGAAGTSRRVGSELDLTWRLGIDRHTLLAVGYSHFFSGPFIGETGSDRDIDFAYILLQYTF